MKAKRNGCRNIFLVGILFFMAAIAVAAAHFFHGGKTIPPESAELAQKRADRENNGWYLLEQLYAEVPARPLPLWGPIPDDPKTEANYKALPGSLGSRALVDRPDDDPLLQEYLASAQRLVPRLRDVLAKPYILLPPEASDPNGGEFFHHWNRGSYFEQNRILFPLLLTHAFDLSGQPGGSAESAQIVRNCCELIERLYEASAMEFVYGAYDTVWDTLVRLQPEHQRELLTWALQMQAQQRPSRQKLEFDLRQHKIFLDHIRKEGTIFRPLEIPQYIRHRMLFMRHFDYLFKTAYMKPKEFQRLLEQDPIVMGFDSNFVGFSLNQDHSFTARWNSMMNTAILILAIELYRHQHDKLPEALNELATAGYIAQLPEDPYADTGVTYLYESTQNEYRLLRRSERENKDIIIFARKTENPESPK